MRAQLKIVSGSLRGRKLTCNVSPDLRPTPQRVREALFSLLGNGVPDRPFVDVFAGTGINGLEAISRGATSTTFVERDFRLLGDLQKHLKAFGVDEKAFMARSDAYRWAERWQPPPTPVNIFISPPFADFNHKLDRLWEMIERFQEQVEDHSVIVLQGEDKIPLESIPTPEEWDHRRYGRNLLLIWVKEPVEEEAATGEHREES